MQTPVIVIGGYLGSGKTTLVNHLLRNANGKRLAILVNEFGELPIDADLIEAEEDDIISLAGGCVCCSYGNDLIMAMMDMSAMEPRPDHIILESSGVALPGAIAGSLSLLPDFRVDGIVVLTDVETIVERSEDRYMGDTITRQLSDANIILLNKTDLVQRDEIIRLRNWLANAAPEAALVETQNAELDPAVVLGEVQNFTAPSTTDGKFTVDHASARFITRHICIDHAIDPDDFAEELLRDDPNLIRAKGFILDMQGALKTLQLVGRRWQITPAPPGVTTGIVTISIRHS